MFYYIDQTRTPFFPNGLVKIESDFIGRSVEIDSGRWMLVVAVISVDAYPFFSLSDLTCHLEDTGIGVSCSHSIAWKCMEICPYSYFQLWRYFWDPGVSFVMTDKFSVRITKLFQGLVSHELTVYLSAFDLFSTQWVMVILLKVCKPQIILN